MIQPISALSTEKFFGLLLFQLTTTAPQVSLKGSIPCGKVWDGGWHCSAVGQGVPPRGTAPTEPSWARSWGSAAPPSSHPQETSPTHGERKRAQTLLGAGASPPGTAWPPPPAILTSPGSLSPAPSPPRRAGSSLERQEQL